MKKVCALLCVAFPLFAQIPQVEYQKPTRSVEEIKKETRMVRYTITVYTDEGQDSEQWRKIVDDAADTIEEVSSGKYKSGDEIVSVVFDAVQRANTKSNNPGVHSSIVISLGDGNCKEDQCNPDCACKDEYRGLCPCSLDSKSSCK